MEKCEVTKTYLNMIHNVEFCPNNRCIFTVKIRFGYRERNAMQSRQHSKLSLNLQKRKSQ